MTECISFKDTDKFSKLVLDYLNQEEKLTPFISRFPSLPNFGEQILEKQKNFPLEHRKILTRVLGRQYKELEISEATRKNIDALSGEDTFTVTTGHQLNLFTGPLYFIFKIISTINLASELNSRFSSNFVPVYWMATEDHDFEEVSFFNLHGKKFKWNPGKNETAGGPVGEISTEGLEEVFALFSAEIGSGGNAEKLKQLFRDSYLEHKSLTDATRYLVNELFRDYGLVILDGQDRELKQLFSPFMEEELKSGVSYRTSVPKAQALEELGYKVQVNPRKINLFYLAKGLRERIIKKDGRYFIHGTKMEFSEKEILKLLAEEPERFSPNVITRPLYQEVLLPNLCYIGGGGELAYWFELRDYFEAANISFPILLLRNSALLQSIKQGRKREKLNITSKELFLKQHELINKKVRQISNIEIDFSQEKEVLSNQFKRLYQLAEQTEKSFLGAVRAQEVKQLKGLDHLEKRLLKAQKRKLENEVTRIIELQQELFPHKMLQERHSNFSEFYLEFGEELFAELKKELQPLDPQFKILTL